MEEKKKYVKPEAEVVVFSDEDIITLSSTDAAAGFEDGEDF